MTDGYTVWLAPNMGTTAKMASTMDTLARITKDLLDARYNSRKPRMTRTTGHPNSNINQLVAPIEDLDDVLV